MSIRTATSDGAPASRTGSQIRLPLLSAGSGPVRHSTVRTSARTHIGGSLRTSVTGADQRNRTVASATDDGPWFCGTSRVSTRPPDMVICP
ncbi:hypothetical protein ACIPWY_36985 [Streptomyces sp. NPDC090032]|uniref:hypothetical protein n=1 Tax=Streptomyces sp. NPDC090032 TaxID=3365925 RepID=UPI0037FEBD47